MIFVFNNNCKVFKRSELEMIAKLCERYNTICISDEVYEWSVYHGKHKHFRIATLPNMWDRTITIGSAGKIFSATGLKVGWIIAHQDLIRGCQIVHKVCKTLFLSFILVCPVLYYRIRYFLARHYRKKLLLDV